MAGSVRSRWAAIGAGIAVTLGGGVGLVRAAGSDAGDLVLVTLDQPCRLMDLRPTDQVGPRGTPLGAGEEYVVSAHGAQGNCNIPVEATALALNVTAASATQLTNLRLYAEGADRPLVSSLNPAPGEPPTPNAVTVRLSDDGKFVIFNAFGEVPVIADVSGYYVGHDHDDRYYTKAEVDAAIAASEGGGAHDHDDRYFTKDVIDLALTQAENATNAVIQPTALGSVEGNAPAFLSSAGFDAPPTVEASIFRLSPTAEFNVLDGDVALVTPRTGCDAGTSVQVGSISGDIRVRLHDLAGALQQCHFTIVVYDTGEFASN